jgi:hypothetical protein
LDLDAVNARRLSIRAFRSCFVESAPDWHVVTATQRHHYYDIWALRGLGVDYDCWAAVRAAVAAGEQREEAVERLVKRWQRALPGLISNSSSWVEVGSAFGGLAVYDTRSLMDCEYVGAIGEAGEEEVCEHVSVHTQIRERGGRIYINPNLVNGGRTTSLTSRLRSRLRLTRA